MDKRWQVLLFVGFWVVLAIGLRLEDDTPEGQARINETWENTAKNLADETASDTSCSPEQQIQSPDLCEKLRKDAENEFKKKLSVFR